MESRGTRRLALFGDFRDQKWFSLTPSLSIATPGLATRPDEVRSISGPRSLTQWFNTAALAAPAFGFYGTAAPGIIQGPGMVNFDMAVYKDFRIHERHTIQFRSEFFNIFNHTNFNGVSTGLGSGNFGQVVSAASPRILEFVLRYQF